jgi:hypothetical protein
MAGAKKAQIANLDIYPQKKLRKKCVTNLILQIMMLKKKKYAVIIQKMIVQVAKFVQIQKYTMTTIT